MSDISKALNLLEKLVGFPTASHRSNRALVAFIWASSIMSFPTRRVRKKG